MSPPSPFKNSSFPTSSPSRQTRVERAVRPLGSARRTGRSRTPTPANPHPDHIDIESTLNEAVKSEPIATRSNTRLINAAATSTLRNSSQSSSSSSSSSSYNQLRSTQPQAEKRPWFPYPSSTKDPGGSENQRSSSVRRVSNLSTDSASTSSASSYNSEDINTRIKSNNTKRAQSAEPEQAASAAARGRPWRGRALRRGDDMHDNTIQEGQVAEENDPASSSSDDEKERAHFKSVLKAFDAYLSHSLAANNARRRSFYSLPRSHRLLLSSLGSTIPGPLLIAENIEGEENAPLLVAGRGFKARLDEIDDRIRRNADVLGQILDDSRGFLGEEEDGERAEGVEEATASLIEQQARAADAVNIKSEAENVSDKAKVEEAEISTSTDNNGTKGPEGSRSDSRSSQNKSKERPLRARVPDRDMDKVRSTIKQFVRDWSIEGSTERESAYDPILEALEETFKHVSSAQRTQLRILVPGAGLGRLAFEIAWLGFSCQGNEFSFYMLLASHFILNKTTKINQHIIYPFIHSSSNWRTAGDMLRPIQIPDINPSDLPYHVDFSMVAGEFVEVYSKEQEMKAWDAVTTCFFIDTAHNLTRYLEVVNQILVMGGVWINVGPLLWHYEGAFNGDLSIELTLDEVLNLVELMGFSVESRRTLQPQCYTGNQDSMLKYRYSPEFWLARKVRDVTPAKAV